jgi:hypothetical protein
MPAQNKASWYEVWAATVPFTKLMREQFLQEVFVNDWNLLLVPSI